MKRMFGNSGSFAKTTVNEAWLFTEFGENYARKIFGDEIEKLPRYKKGKHSGMLKGYIAWVKVIKGGWISGYGIIKPGITFGHGIWEQPYGDKPILKIGENAYITDYPVNYSKENGHDALYRKT